MIGEVNPDAVPAPLDSSRSELYLHTLPVGPGDSHWRGWAPTERERETDRDRDRDRETEKETERDRDRDTERQRQRPELHAERQRSQHLMHPYTLPVGPGDSHWRGWTPTKREIDRDRDRQTDRQTETETET